ncbi:MAG: hypothetical protein LBD48_01595 [Treponema sp.]|jgi:hypothetical protein|nr:hypothetical protein [Treponema sp.]
MADTKHDATATLPIVEKPVQEMTEAEQWAVFFRYVTDKSKRQKINEIISHNEGIAMVAGILLETGLWRIADYLPVQVWCMTFKSSYWLRESRKASRYPCLFGEIINRLFLRKGNLGAGAGSLKRLSVQSVSQTVSKLVIFIDI